MRVSVVTFLCSIVVLAAYAALPFVAYPPGSGDSSSDKRAPVVVPLQLMSTGDNNECYLVNVSVGTPAQEFGLTLDNEFSAIHVIYVGAHDESPASCRAAYVSRKRFNDTASETYVSWGLQFIDEKMGSVQPYENDCSEYAGDAIGWLAPGFSDTVQIGSASQPSIPAYLIIDMQYSLNPKWKADGIFGIQPLEGGEQGPLESSANTLIAFLTGFERPQITLYYARSEVGDGEDGGVMTIGGADNENCASNWSGKYTVDGTQNQCGWCLMLKSASIGGRNLSAGDYYEVVTKSSFVTAPRSAIDVVLKVTGAEYDFKSDTYQVDCAKRASLPDMVFQLPDMEYRLPAVDYARKLRVTDKRCTLILKLDESPVRDDGAWKLGTAFFRPYCTLVDYSASTFQFSKARH